MGLIGRYIIMRADQRKMRWWKRAAEHRDSAPDWLAALIEQPDGVADAELDEILAVDAWRDEHGLDEPPVTIIDRLDERPESREFCRNLAKAYGSWFSHRALREVLMRDDLALVVTPDADDDAVWHCRLEGHNWGWTGADPSKAVQAAMDSLISDLLEQPA